MKKDITIFAICVITTCFTFVGYCQKPNPVIEPFDYKGIQLNDGRLQQQFEIVKNEYLRTSNDDLLIGFRKRANLPAPGKELGGWYSADSFNIFGQIIGGLSRMYAATGDKQCLEKVNSLVAEWAKTIDPNGFFYYTVKPNAPHYTYEKMVGGLLDAYVYCDNKQANECLSKITVWAIKNLDRKKVYAFNAGQGNTEWYTLSENLYRAWLITGDQKYLDFAREWEYTEYLDIFAKGGNIFDRWGDYHAYSHVNAVNGAGSAYMATGQEHYLKTLINAYDYFNTHQCFATGGFGPRERFKRNRAELIGSLCLDEHHFETQCGSWAAFKMCKYLLTYTGDARFGDWIERLVFNGIGATLPADADGSIQYWSNYNVYGASKKNSGVWSCCAGSRPQAVADYHDLIWFKDANNIYVNLYEPSTLKWKFADDTVTISQKGILEESQTIEFTISLAGKSEFGIYFRLPGWLKKPALAKVNGQSVELASNQKHWAVLKQTWNDGDKISLTLPMGITVNQIVAEKPYFLALSYGPVVLAVDCEKTPRLKNINWKDANEMIEISKSPLVLSPKSNPEIVLKPYYSFAAEEHYKLYIDPNSGIVHKPQFIGRWQKSSAFMYSNAADSIAKAVFEGTSIRWLGAKFDDAGKAEVSIDGTVVDIIDQYGPGRDLPFEWKHEGLEQGTHVISVRVLGQKNENSKNTYINVASFKPILQVK
ncbi:MAG: hypothetical protein A2Y10_05050 [Planctomycetes bacterium GWF2_41_51]|nr:MAG: hypothetical protein A2Y10_05050 [Planctomycetes bacterium GWF2_41_51]HBG25568.1 hypothetical protein [Phycisphaerales bacterium]